MPPISGSSQLGWENDADVREPPPQQSEPVNHHVVAESQKSVLLDGFEVFPISKSKTSIHDLDTLMKRHEEKDDNEDK